MSETHSCTNILNCLSQCETLPLEYAQMLERASQPFTKPPETTTSKGWKKETKAHYGSSNLEHNRRFNSVGKRLNMTSCTLYSDLCTQQVAGETLPNSTERAVTISG